MPPKGARSKSPTGGTPLPIRSRSRSPQASSSSSGGYQIDKAVVDMLMKAKIEDSDCDYKSTKIPLFSDGTEWEEVVFELETSLDRIWKHQKELDIVDYLHGAKFYCDQKWIEKADKIIYHILVTAAKRDSFARKQIMAARHSDAVPKVERNEGLKLFEMFQTIFLQKTTHQANLPNAQKNFYQMQMKESESAKDYIARVDSAVAELALLKEKVSIKSWLYIMSNGLRAEYGISKKGVLFSEAGFDNVIDLKANIMKEETIIGISKPVEKAKEKAKETETANAAFEGTCDFCSKKGHKKQDCFAFKKTQKQGAVKPVAAKGKGKAKPIKQLWCDHCQKSTHSTDWCWWKPAIEENQKGKNKGKVKGKGKGKAKGKGNRNGNFPASYNQEGAYWVKNEWEDLHEEQSTSWNQDYNFSIFDSKDCEPAFIISEEKRSLTEENSTEENGINLPVFETVLSQEKEFSPNQNNFLFVATESTNWSINNAWNEQDFKLCTRGDQPTLAKGGPGCDFLLNAWTNLNDDMKNQLKAKTNELKERKEKGEAGLWMYLDSGASRSVIQEESPIRQYLSNVSTTTGSCNVGNGANLKYLERGTITKFNDVTVVQDLRYDLYAAVAAAKRGITCVIDFDEETGYNQSYLLCKKSQTITPLIERKRGILEVPIHLYVNGKNDVGLMVKNQKPSMSTISKFWFGMEQSKLDPTNRSNNKDEISLFTYDIIHSLNERQRDFLIHARLAHIPSKAIMQMIKNGSTGLPFKGKFKELCRPCLESRQRARDHGKEKVRHPNGKIGEHLHSDLAVVNIKDYSGFKYVLTIVDEVSDEVVATLLKTKNSEDVLAACKKSLKIISARSNSKLKTWQFDRGGEFLNDIFEEWIQRDLGATQLFSNVEHPWENGRAERSFSTIFAKARAMLKHADLPNGLWGKAVVHAVFLKNRCPSRRLNFKAPLQFRTGEPINFKRLRVFGCPAQIFVRQKERENNKLSSRSEKGTFIGMSKIGNGFIFRIKRTGQFVEVDSSDAMFNETFSDCRDRRGKIIKGGRILDPDLYNVPDMEADVSKSMESWKATTNDKDPASSENGEVSKSFQNDKVSESFIDEVLEKFQNDEVSENLNDKVSEKLKNDEVSKNPKQPIKSREIKRLQSSKGFEAALKRSGGNRRNQRIQRSSNEPALNLSAKDEDEDETDFDKEEKTFGQLLSCMEQNRKQESGKLNNEEEQSIHNHLLEIGSPDPKSQAAINKMPAEKRKRYNDATMKEFQGMKHKGVMENVRISDIPPGMKIYICVVNWVTKFVLGNYSKTKCRICFGGHHYVKTFVDCFAPTVNFCSVLIMLCLAAMFSWSIGSLDYSQAYLNATIDEECYLRAPEFLREFDHDGTEFVWKLKKVIYGHPKGSRLWAECLTNKLKELGYYQLSTDQCVYAKWRKWDVTNLQDDSHFVFILIHSDDLIVISNLHHIMMKEKKLLLHAFEGIDQGKLSSFCGVEIAINDKGIELSMNYYWLKLMKRFGIGADEKENRPIKIKVNKDDCPIEPNEDRKKTYLQIIGSIIFGFTHCRLDLALPVGMLTRVMHSPSEAHLKQLYGLLKYLNATKNWGLKFFKDSTVKYGMKFVFFAFCDSSHADDESSSRSTGGWFFFLRRGQGCICSKSGQTPDVALSSTEAETIWACSAATQGAYIKQFIDELKIFGETSFELMEDSQPAINAQKKNVSQSKFRHIKIKYHYLRQLLSEGWCKLVKIGTKDQMADIATKILPSTTTEYFSKAVLGIYNTDTDALNVTVDVDQSLHYCFEPYCTMSYNDWGVMSTPYSVVGLNVRYGSN
jgi:transposase InsO family protein